MSLLEKLRDSGSIKTATSLADSIYFNQKDVIQTPIPIINVAFSGRVNGGFTPGLTVLAGPSKNFKSSIGLLCLKSYLKKYPDAVALLYDSEFGITPDYVKANGIDPNRVVHIPIEHIEQLKFDMSKRLESIERGDKVFILVDSLGNLASKKEVEDALEEKGAADMTRAKQIKSLFRIVTPHFTMKNIPCFVINHTYEEQGMFPKQIVSGGTGVYYSADTIWIMGRQQDKEGMEIVGWNFVINVEKSRFVKEKSKMIFNVNYDRGISTFGGLFDLGVEAGYITSPSKGWYNLKGSDKKLREKDLLTKEVWMPILTDKEFRDFVEHKFVVSNPNGTLTDEEDISLT